MTHTLTLSARILAAAAADPIETAQYDGCAARTLAARLAAALVTDTRTSGETFVKFSDDLGAWDSPAHEIAHRVARAAHDSAWLPDDWVYSVLPGVLEGIADEGEDFDPEGLVDIYTARLLAWLTVPGAADALNEYVTECGWPEGGLNAAIMGAQFDTLRGIVAGVWAELEAIVEENEPEEIEEEEDAL